MSALGAVGYRFASGRVIPKAIKMILAAPLLMLAVKGRARKIKEGRIFVMSQ